MYRALARRYRPQRFADVVGQDTVVTTLKNALRLGKVAHAYLFSGSRGTGKTTLARILSKSLNCSNLENCEPCNACPSCLDITQGQSLDMLEIDGASNRGIDDIRQLNETALYAPAHGRYKVILIDEVHMLTKEAFNALLKTLEEPPERAKFLFATTEPHKVPPTILSRCQRFELTRLSPAHITAKLNAIAADLNRTIEAEALHLIAHAADGSLRDAEILLDQLLCDADLTAASVRQALGLTPQERLFELDAAFATAHLPFAFQLVEQLLASGLNLNHFLQQLIEHYRLLTLCKTGHPSSDAYRTAAQHYTTAQCLYILEYLIHNESLVHKSLLPHVALESLLLHLIRSRYRIPHEVLVRKLLEKEEPLVLEPVPFQPKPLKQEERHPSHYETLLRFAAVELEGSVFKS